MKLIFVMAFLAASLAASSHADAQYTNNRPLVYGGGATRMPSINPTRPDAYYSTPASDALRQQMQGQELDSANQRVREQIQDMIRQTQPR